MLAQPPHAVAQTSLACRSAVEPAAVLPGAVATALTQAHGRSGKQRPRSLGSYGLAVDKLIFGEPAAVVRSCCVAATGTPHKCLHFVKHIMACNQGWVAQHWWRPPCRSMHSGRSCCWWRLHCWGSSAGWPLGQGAALLHWGRSSPCKLWPKATTEPASGVMVCTPSICMHNDYVDVPTGARGACNSYQLVSRFSARESVALTTGGCTTSQHHCNVLATLREHRKVKRRIPQPAKSGPGEPHPWQALRRTYFSVCRLRGQRPAGAVAGYNFAHWSTASIMAAHHALPVCGCCSDGGHGGRAVPAVPQLARPGQRLRKVLLMRTLPCVQLFCTRMLPSLLDRGPASLLGRGYVRG